MQKKKREWKRRTRKISHRGHREHREGQKLSSLSSYLSRGTHESGSSVNSVAYFPISLDKTCPGLRSGIRAQNIRRMASLERTKKEVVKEMAADATNRDPGHKRPLVVTMDGALHLWDLVRKTLSGIDFVGILRIIYPCGGISMEGSQCIAW